MSIIKDYPNEKWDFEIGLHADKENWIFWKEEAIDHYIKGLSVANELLSFIKGFK